jgi:guanylate kinase
MTGKLIVLTGPSGVGKGTLLKALLRRHPDLKLSISATTRAPRDGEVDGKDYHFLSRVQFEQLAAKGEFLEWAEFAGNLYGTPRSAVEALIQQGDSVIVEIELEGARQIRRTYPDALKIFILPPSLAVLEDRIRGRGTDSAEAIIRRLQRATEEVEAAHEFDVQIVNDEFDRALKQIETILVALPAAC